MSLVGGIDGGGTTFKCVIAERDGSILATERFPADRPETTLAACVRFFRDQAARDGRDITALGIGCFGPLDLDPGSAQYGAILATPKPHWSGAAIASHFERELGIPVAIDTDVNAALAAEMRWGAAQALASAAYVTIGTGIGAGIFANGGFLGRPAHPEFGHIAIARHPQDEHPGSCSFHGDCLEGLASARAMHERFGDPAQLGPDHLGWDIEAHYLAQACRALFLLARPERIILGGGLMLAEGLLERTRTSLVTQMSGYLAFDTAQAERLVVRAALGDDAGILGGVALALDKAG